MGKADTREAVIAAKAKKMCGSAAKKQAVLNQARERAKKKSVTDVARERAKKS